MFSTSIESSQLELQRVYDGVISAGFSAEPIRNENDEILAIKLPNAVDTSKVFIGLGNEHALEDDKLFDEVQNLGTVLPFQCYTGLYPSETLDLIDLIVDPEDKGKLATNFSGSYKTDRSERVSDLHIDSLRELDARITGLNIHITRIGEVAVRFGLLRNLDNYDDLEGWTSRALETSCAPFSEPCVLKSNDVVVFRGTGRKSGLHPVAHEFVSLTRPRLSDIFTPVAGEPTEILEKRNLAIEQFGLQRFGYQIAA